MKVSFVFMFTRTTEAIRCGAFADIKQLSRLHSLYSVRSNAVRFFPHIGFCTLTSAVLSGPKVEA